MIVDAVLGIVNGILSLGASKDYSQQISEQAKKQQVSEGVKRGESMYRELAYTDPSVTQQESLQEAIPKTLNEMKKFASGGGLIKSVSDLSAGIDDKMQQAILQRDQLVNENKRRYADYLGSVTGGAEERVQDKKTQLELASAFETLSGKQAEMSWMNTGIGSIEGDALKLLSSNSQGGGSWWSSLAAGKEKPTGGGK